jgi:protein translocase SecG subunit
MAAFFTGSCQPHFSLIHSVGMNLIDTVLSVLPYIQIILSILLVTAIILQQRGSSLGGAFGGDNYSSTFNKRRGAEEFLFRFSIVIAILFVFSAFLNVLL